MAGNHNSGRPSMGLTRRFIVKLTEQQRIKLARLGGSAWMRQAIDLAKEKAK